MRVTPVDGWDQFEVTRRVLDMVDVNATLKTDGMGGFNDLSEMGYTHIRTISARLGEDEYFSPVLHTQIANLKAQIQGTYHRRSGPQREQHPPRGSSTCIARSTIVSTERHRTPTTSCRITLARCTTVKHPPNPEVSMFHDIPSAILERMHELERRDEIDRTDGTPRLDRLRQIPEETGRFIALWAASAPDGAMIEIGTSAGYSALWLSLACRAKERTLTTFEVLAKKAAIARQTFSQAGVGHLITLVEGDFLDHVDGIGAVGFCFLDAEKEAYAACYDSVVPRLVPGGLLVADNAINHRETLQPMIDAALEDERVDALVVPIGKGELVCRRRT